MNYTALILTALLAAVLQPHILQAATLDKDEIGSRFSNMLVTGHHDKKLFDFTHHYHGNGVLIENSQNGEKRGTWRVSDDGLCEKWDGKDEKCRTLDLTDGIIRSYNKHGSLVSTYVSFAPLKGPQDSGITPPAMHGGETVLVLPPRVVFLDVKTNEELQSRKVEAEHHKQLLEASILTELRNHSLNPVAFDKSGDAIAARNENMLQELESHYNTIISPYKNKSHLLPLLVELSKEPAASLICVTTLVVEVGSGGGFEPISGSSWHSTHSSLFRGAILSLESGKHVMHNEVYLRNLPSDTSLPVSVRDLFSGL